MKEKKEKPKREKPVARAKSQYTIYNVKEPAELMEFLMAQMEGISRSSVKSLLSNRRVFVDNTIRTQYNFELKRGMKVQISKKKNNKEFHSPFLKLVYEDAYLLVVEKKAGLPSIGIKNKTKERSAYSILGDYTKRAGSELRIQLVHKLDKEASGLMIFAKDEKTKLNLQDRWKEIVKDMRYVAVLSGEMDKDSGVFSSWIVDGKSYFSSTVPKDADEDRAITHYKVIKRRNGYTLTEISTESGMKVQIRLHMQELGYPVVGDEKFGNGDNPLNRLGLHVFKLDFYHPVTRELLKFETTYPSNFKSVLVKKEEE